MGFFSQMTWSSVPMIRQWVHLHQEGSLLLGAAAVRGPPNFIVPVSGLRRGDVDLLHEPESRPFWGTALDLHRGRGALTPQSPGLQSGREGLHPIPSCSGSMPAPSLKETIKDSFGSYSKSRPLSTHKIFTYFIRPYFGCCFAFQIRGTFMILMIHAPVI